jgi:hypothetical protein
MKAITAITDKVLIGGRALVALGSNRLTTDTDYLICDPELDIFAFDRENNVDYCNAAKNKFFADIWKKEKGNTIASPQSLLDLKAYAFVQNCQNFHFKKADDAEFDMKFLVRTFRLTDVPVAKKHLSAGEYGEIKKIIASVRF